MWQKVDYRSFELSFQQAFQFDMLSGKTRFPEDKPHSTSNISPYF